MNLFDLNNDILIKIQEELAIKRKHKLRKHKLFLSNLINHRDQFYNESWYKWYKWFDLDCFEDHLKLVSEKVFYYG